MGWLLFGRRWLLSDYVKVTQASANAEDILFTDADLQGSMDRIECLHLHQELTVNGIKFSAFNAGHVLGAVMFLIEIAGVKVYFDSLFHIFA